MTRRTAALVKSADAAPIFAALGDTARLQIVAKLCKGGPLSIVKLTEGSEVSRQAITKHLQVLERAQLVRGDRSGRERLWQVETRRLGDVQRYLDQISSQWDAAIERLRVMVETHG